jgi:hypothetical protein
MTHELTFTIFFNVPDDPDIQAKVSDVIYQAGFDDALFSIKDSVGCIDVERSGEEADLISSILTQMHKVFSMMGWPLPFRHLLTAIPHTDRPTEIVIIIGEDRFLRGFYYLKSTGKKKE